MKQVSNRQKLVVHPREAVQKYIAQQENLRGHLRFQQTSPFTRRRTPKKS